MCVRHIDEMDEFVWIQKLIPLSDTLLGPSGT